MSGIPGGMVGVAQMSSVKGREEMGVGCREESKGDGGRQGGAGPG